MRNVSKKIKKYSNIGFALYIVFTLVGGTAGMKMGDDYKYDEIELEYFAITRDNYLEYTINHKKDIVESSTDELGNVVTTTKTEEFKFKYTYDDNNIIIRNENTKEEVKIECEQLIDFIVIEDHEKFILAYEDYQGNNNPFLYYIYINKEQLSNEKGYLEKVKKAEENIFVIATTGQNGIMVLPSEERVKYISLTTNQTLLTRIFAKKYQDREIAIAIAKNMNFSKMKAHLVNALISGTITIETAIAVTPISGDLEAATEKLG